VAQDPYSELGVARGASADEIRKSFRKLAKTHHPDANPNNKTSEERFKRITAAFDILGDEEKRKKYDRGEIDADGRETHPGFRPGQGGGFAGGSPFGGGGFRPGGGGGDFEGVNFDEILGEMFGRGGGGPGVNMGGRGRGFAAKGADVRARLDIDLEDAIKGVTRRITFGDGKSLDVTIPKGAAEGQVLRLRGQGQPGRGGAAGDALIELAIKPHPLYRIDGADLHMELPISVPDAVLGAKVEAPTPDGPVTLTVAKHSNAGATLRLRGRGAVNAETGKRGDLFAHLVVSLPDPPDPELDRFAEIWRKDRPYTPRRKG
jgi:DnaJ-class molecular chaperone